VQSQVRVLQVPAQFASLVQLSSDWAHCPIVDSTGITQVSAQSVTLAH
jgi:hypothetical protein